MRLPRKIKKACKKYLVLGAVLNTNALRCVNYQCNKTNKKSKALAVLFLRKEISECKRFICKI